MKTILFLLAVLGSSVAAADGLKVQLSISPVAILPGTACAFTVTFTNSGDTPVQIINGLRFHAAQGEQSFVVTGPAGADVFGIPGDQADNCDDTRCLKLPAGATRELLIDPGPSLTENVAFFDRRLSSPGTVNLQVEVIAGDNNDGTQTLLSNNASLTIVEPDGVDADVWQHMKVIAGQSSWSSQDWINSGARLANDVLTAYPTSSYVPWVVAYTPGNTATAIAACDLGLSKNPPAVRRDSLLLGKARRLLQASDDALIGDRNEEEALAYSDDAAVVLNTLINVATSSVTRQRAKMLQGKILTPKAADDIMRTLLANAPPATSAIQPVVNCVTPGDNSSFTAMFGYNNPNDNGKTIPLGANNEVTPAPRDQHQPRFFRPGVHDAAFVARSAGGNLIWHLDGSRAVATADFAVQCVQPAASASH